VEGWRGGRGQFDAGMDGKGMGFCGLTFVGGFVWWVRFDSFRFSLLGLVCLGFYRARNGPITCAGVLFVWGFIGLGMAWVRGLG
jgi:hypothetical protein